MDKLRFEFCQGVFQGRQEIANKVKALIREIEGDYPHSDNVTKIAISGFIKDLKDVVGNSQPIGKDQDE